VFLLIFCLRTGADPVAGTWCLNFIWSTDEGESPNSESIYGWNALLQEFRLLLAKFIGAKNALHWRLRGGGHILCSTHFFRKSNKQIAFFYRIMYDFMKCNKFSPFLLNIINLVIKPCFWSEGEALWSCVPCACLLVPSCDFFMLIMI